MGTVKVERCRRIYRLLTWMMYEWAWIRSTNLGHTSWFVNTNYKLIFWLDYRLAFNNLLDQGLLTVRCLNPVRSCSMFNTFTDIIGSFNIDEYSFSLEYLVVRRLLQVSRPASVTLCDIILATTVRDTPTTWHARCKSIQLVANFGLWTHYSMFGGWLKFPSGWTMSFS